MIPAESEEEQFRLRNVRLGEKGFLPFHEAVGIYQPLRPEKLPSARKKVLRERFRDDPVYPVPQFANNFIFFVDDKHSPVRLPMCRKFFLRLL